MRLTLGPVMSMRLIQCQNLPQIHIMCMLPLLELNLKGLKRFKEYLEGLTPEEIEALGTLSHKGSGRKAFHDINLETLLEGGHFSELDNPDVRLKVSDNELTYEFYADEQLRKFPQGNPEDEDSLIRNSKYLLRNVEWVTHALRQAYEIIINHQKDYLSSNKVDKLKHLTQQNVADKMGIAESTLGRLIKDKSLRTLDGCIMPLYSLIIQQKGINQLRAYEVIGKMLNDGTYSSDELAVKTIYERTGGENGGLLLARRTVSKYRSELEDYKLKTLRQRSEED